MPHFPQTFFFFSLVIISLFSFVSIPSQILPGYIWTVQGILPLTTEGVCSCLSVGHAISQKYSFFLLPFFSRFFPSPSIFHHNIKVRISVFSKNTKYLFLFTYSCFLCIFLWIREKSACISQPSALLALICGKALGSRTKRSSHDIERSMPIFSHSP